MPSTDPQGRLAQRPVDFFDQAIIDVDGTLVGTDAECKRASTSPTTAPGAIIPCWSRWPTPRSRCTWSIAAATAPRMNWPPAASTGPIVLCRQAGFSSFFVRGDTDFTQTKHLDPLG